MFFLERVQAYSHSLQWPDSLTTLLRSPFCWKYCTLKALHPECASFKSRTESWKGIAYLTCPLRFYKCYRWRALLNIPLTPNLKDRCQRCQSLPLWFECYIPKYHKHTLKDWISCMSCYELFRIFHVINNLQNSTARTGSIDRFLRTEPLKRLMA